MSLSDKIVVGTYPNKPENLGTGVEMCRKEDVKEFIKKMLELLRGYSFNSPEMFSIIDKFKEEAGDKLT